MGPILIIGSVLSLVTLALVLYTVFEKDKSILKEVFSLWLGLAGLSVLAYCYTALII